jgi:hypothetical protein
MNEPEATVGGEHSPKPSDAAATPLAADSPGVPHMSASAAPTRTTAAAPATEGASAASAPSGASSPASGNDARPSRRVKLPVALFLASCASTFWVGTTFLAPKALHVQAIVAGEQALAQRMSERIEAAREENGGDDAARPLERESPMLLWLLREGAQQRYLIEQNYEVGMSYMLAVMGILLCHELGHFLQAVRHRVPASLPYFIPMPLNPMGTMGAVIGMDSLRADRRQLFDIGISGPLAGLVVAVPLIWVGIERAEPLPRGEFARPRQILQQMRGGDPASLERAERQLDALLAHEVQPTFHMPWLVELMIERLRPDLEGQLPAPNAFLLAGWVGLLITGLNMMPISQLDGGHVIYALLGPSLARLVAKLFLISAIVYVVFFEDTAMWIMMLVLVILIGFEHPPTADDEAELSLAQRAVGFASLAIPFLCFPPQGITFQ